MAESEAELERERDRSNAALSAWQLAGSQAKALKASLDLQRRKSVQLSSLAEEAKGRLEVTRCTLLADVREMEAAHAETHAMLEAVRNVSRLPHTSTHNVAYGLHEVGGSPVLRQGRCVAWQMAAEQEVELRCELEARGYALQRLQGCCTIEQENWRTG